MQRKTKRALLPVFLTFFLDNFGLAIIYPIFTPLLIGSETSILPDTTPYAERTILLGLLIACFPLAQFFGAPLIGQFSDRFGRKISFLISILGTTLGYILTAVSIHLQSVPGLLLSRFISGFFAGNLTICLAAIADLSHDDVSRTRNFSLISVAGGLSFIVAIAFGGVLSDPSISRSFNPSVPFWIIALFSLINLILMVTLFHETHPRAHPGINPLKGVGYLFQSVQNKELCVLYSVNFLYKIAWVACMQFLPIYLIGHYKFDLTGVTLSLMGAGALWSLANLIINRQLAIKYYVGDLLLWNLLALSILLLFTLITNSSTSFLMLFFPAVCFAALCWTNVLAIISLKAPLAIQGSVMGVNQSVTSMATMVGPIIGGLLAALHKDAIYAFGGAACLAAFLLLFFCKAYEKHSKLD